MHSYLLTLAAAGVASAGHVSMAVSREKFNFNLPASITRRQSSNATDNSVLLQAMNNMTGGGYYAEFGIGTPPQKIGFLLDTGSSDTWMNSAESNLCTSVSQQNFYGYCMKPFDPDESSTLEIVDKGGFDITYLDGRNIMGDYINDTVTIGGQNITGQQLGLALDTVRPAGIMGLGFSKNVASSTKYPTIVDNMVSQGLIDTPAYSLWLNTIDSDEGSILFGAIDQKKFVGSLAKMDLHPDELSDQDEALHFNVKLTGFRANSPDDANDIDLGTLDSHAVLDSGSTICLMPDDQVQKIHEEFGVVAIDGLLAPFADCAWRGDKGRGYSFDFKFEGKVIRVPLSEMVVNAYEEVQDQLMGDPEARRLFGSWDSVCIFGIGSTADFGFEGDGFTLLGDTFLRSAYVVYDLANEQIGLAQANHDTDESDLVEIKTGDLPDVKGVEEASSIDGAGFLASSGSAGLLHSARIALDTF
ncbi:hypothetical protein NLU13_4148 [Sarocladium strictum]|uniref:Peptidase A1 domain-containing protein n=1 Tax=Sarocladium strictum TaxID=5046 RepID=A0AA39L8D4_SARSR|nr:hypothetical protein NLU13_4148 [Sarocladium strictum]